MKRSSPVLTAFLLLSVLMLPGCMSRDQADARLARGCIAGAALFLEDGVEVKQIRNSIFRDDPQLGPGYREVRLVVLEGDGWYDTDKEYKCIFVESMGPFGMSHTATIYQVNVNGEIYGQDGDKILGGFDDHLMLTETVEQAMNR